MVRLAVGMGVVVASVVVLVGGCLLAVWAMDRHEERTRERARRRKRMEKLEDWQADATLQDLQAARDRLNASIAEQEAAAPAPTPRHPPRQRGGLDPWP